MSWFPHPTPKGVGGLTIWADSGLRPPLARHGQAKPRGLGFFYIVYIIYYNTYTNTYINMYYNTSSLFYLSRLSLNSVKNFSAKQRKISRKSWKILGKY